MRTTYAVSPKYDFCDTFVRQLTIPYWFQHNGKTIHDGRNAIKLFNVGGTWLAVKCFGHLTLFNRSLYGLFRKSKAQRAYAYASRLRSLGIDSPEAIAFIQNREGGLLQSSYFISKYSYYRPLATVLNTDLNKDETKHILDALTGFIFDVHNSGVLHKDLNINNILYGLDPDGKPGFQLIDNNRMRFCRSLSKRQRVRNIRCISLNAPEYMYVLDRYARVANIDTETTLLQGVLDRLLLKSWRQKKHRAKGRLYQVLNKNSTGRCS